MEYPALKKETIMGKVVVGILIGLMTLYAIIGLIMAFYETIKTDDPVPFDWTIIITWLPKMIC